MGVLSGVGPVGLAAEDPSWIFGELSHQAIDEGDRNMRLVWNWFKIVYAGTVS